MVLSRLALQKIWLIINSVEKTEISYLDDSEVIEYMQKKLAREIILTDREIHSTDNYIQSRLPLIRDLAEIRVLLPKNQMDRKKL